MNDLEIGKNYWTVYGDSPAPGTKGNQIIYLGGRRFRLVNAKETKEFEDQNTYNTIHAWINKPNTSMGMPGGKV